jgi:hypothetical protein
MLWLLATAALAADAPEISRSVGEAGGIVVLYPRIIPASDDKPIRELAKQVETHLRAVADQAAPGAPFDVRPAPERVCPRSGCTAVAVGAVLLHRDDGACAVVVTVTPPGPSAAVLVPWVGALDLRSPTSPFREPPESYVVIRDFATCSDLVASTAGQDAAVVAAIQAARP